MNILVVDDQISVVNGIMSGIKWEELSADNVWRAYNARQAKDIIEREQVDIMLCDIEMPEESGIALYSWMKSEGYRTECIFLTAHADFVFAKEAVHLGSFDYILQPARYEEVQDAIARAQQKITVQKEAEKYSEYGRTFYEKKTFVMDGMVRNLLLGKGNSLESVLADLRQFNIHLEADCVIYPVLLNPLRWEEGKAALEENLLGYVFENIISELAEKINYEVLVNQMEGKDYIVLFYSSEAAASDRKEIEAIMQNVIQLMKDYFGCIAACYMKDAVLLEKIVNEIDVLKEIKKDNVALISKVFSVMADKTKLTEKKETDLMKYWGEALVGGKARWVEEQAFQYLDSHRMNAHMLKRFYHEFIEILFKAEEEIGISNYQIFQDKDIFERFLTAYYSTPQMKSLISYIVEYFMAATENNDSSYVEMVIQYINCNIEKDLRRSDIAGRVNLNEDYLTRIFKKEKGISLKEFIMLEKMTVARNLLKTTNFSIGTIAAKVGFTNFSHFSQTYKKVMGISPAEDR